LNPVFTYNYNAIIRALYIQGICDFGVTYALTGDPLTSSDILSNCLMPKTDHGHLAFRRHHPQPQPVSISQPASVHALPPEEALLRIADSPKD
jgi:hypothetical protein